MSEIKDDLSRYLREAGKQEIVITRHGKPAGVLIGFESEDDWLDYRLENDPRFLRRIEGGTQEPARAARCSVGRSSKLSRAERMMTRAALTLEARDSCHGWRR